MSDYQAVKDALAKGTDPAMLCQTCPWDRNCISPPMMTSGEIDARMAEAAAKDDAHMAANPGAMPTTSLITAVTFAGRDTSGQLCPVFALRLRTGAGRIIADAVRSLMQGWGDDE
jgi:hypothetical protein